jgi:signal transduction histidine kinase
MTASSLPAGTVLVVETEPDALEAIQRCLTDRQYRVYPAPSGKQALDLIQKSPPDVVLLKASLPGETSADVCQHIKKQDAAGFVPVILMIDADRDGYAASAESGADDFLVSPVREAEMLTRVATLLRIRRAHETLRQQNQTLSAELANRRAELEQAVRASREASVLKDSIVQNVSHELRTPMLQIKSAVAMLAEDARAASPNGVSVLADHATAATARLESVVANITQLAASLNVKLEPFRVIDAVNVALRQLGRQWASSAAVDRVKTLLDEKVAVMGDRGGVAQVLQQLIDNAIKFSPDGGPVEINAVQDGDVVHVTVRDYGIGIPADQLGRIFQAFYQVDSSATRPFGGVGVGLAIAKLILDKMGASIWVDSQPGAGSTFSFALPIAHLDEITVSQTENAY